MCGRATVEWPMENWSSIRRRLRDVFQIFFFFGGGGEIETEKIEYEPLRERFKKLEIRFVGHVPHPTKKIDFFQTKCKEYSACLVKPFLLKPFFYIYKKKVSPKGVEGGGRGVRASPINRQVLYF